MSGGNREKGQGPWAAYLVFWLVWPMVDRWRKGPGECTVCGSTRHVAMRDERLQLVFHFSAQDETSGLHLEDREQLFFLVTKSLKCELAQVHFSLVVTKTLTVTTCQNLGALQSHPPWIQLPYEKVLNYLQVILWLGHSVTLVSSQLVC